MEYTSLVEPIFIIFISLLLGMLIGGIGMIYVGSKELKDTQEELDRFRKLVSDWIDWTDEYEEDQR